jgi:leader peptidase (prepilin peptidase)/N-methyltransferase
MNGLNIAGMALLGALVGSFLNVWADRMPSGQSLIVPPSHCPGCQRRLSAWEMVPIVSWLLLRGRCRTCGEPIPIRVLLVELLTAVLFGLVGWRYGIQPYSFLLLLYLSLLIVLSLIDLEHHLIPNQIVFPALLIAALASPLTPTASLSRLWLGGALSFAVLWLIAILLPRGMGMGDVKLTAFIGLIVGFPTVIPMLLLSFILGGVVGAFLLLTGIKGRSDPVPFGPFLAAAGVVGLLYGDAIVQAWLGRL